MKKVICFLALGLTAALAGQAAASVVTSFDFDRTIDDLLVGDLFTANLYLDNSTESEGLLSFGAGISFDPGVVQVTSSAVGSSWAPFVNFTDNLAGEVQMVGTLPLSLPPAPPTLPLQGSNVLLGTINFNTVGPGSFTLLAYDRDPALAEWIPETGPAYDPVDGTVNITFGSAEVAAVPLPGTVLLLGTGVLGLLGIRRKKS